MNSNNKISEIELHYELHKLAKGIAKKFKRITIVSILDGAFMFTSDLLKELYINEVEVELYFIKCKSYVDEMTVSSGSVSTIWDGIENDISNKDVIVIDDIMDTGLTLLHVTNYIQIKYHPKSISTCVLLDKPERRTHKITPTFSVFQIPNRWVWGYGMDLDGMKREIPFITWRNND